MGKRTDEPTILEADQPPKSGRWVDSHDVLGARTADDEERGNRLGRTIDPDDDEDNGLPEPPR